MSKRILGVVAAVVLAAVGTAVLVAYVQGAERRALAGEETVEVLVVSDAVDEGTPADEIGDQITTERVPAKVRADGSVGELDALDGMVTSVALMPGEQLVASRFVTPAQLAEDSGVDVPEGLQTVSISLEPQRAVGGQVAPGDTVGLLASFRPEGQDDPDMTKMILHKLLVTNVQVEQLPQETGDGDDADGGSAPDLAPTGNLLVTLAVDVPQVERITFAAEHGTIWLTAEPEDATEDGSQIRDLGNIYDD